MSGDRVCSPPQPCVTCTEKFTEKFETVVAENVTDDMLIPEITIDAAINFSEINQSFFNIISQMEPFGPENMRPVFVARNVVNSGYSKLLKDQHLKFEVKQNGLAMSGIGFNMPGKADLVFSGQPFDIVFTLDENEFNGNTRLQMMVMDCKPSEK